MEGDPGRPAPASHPDSPGAAYRLFGITLASEIPLTHHLCPGSGAPDVTFGTVRQAPVAGAWPSVPPHCRVPHLHRLPCWDLLRFRRGTDFYVGADRIACHVIDPASARLMELRLLGTVLAFWLERSGVPVLHASAVDVGGRAVAFLSSKRGGKSALAASFIQAGAALLSDDMLPLDPPARMPDSAPRLNAGSPARSTLCASSGSAVGPAEPVPPGEGERGTAASTTQEARPLARSGYPQMRLWPREAHLFAGRDEDLPRVFAGYAKRRVAIGPAGFGTFCAERRPLAGIYIPERRPPGEPDLRVRIEPVPLGEAVFLLLRYSFIPALAAALGLHADRLAFFSRVVQQVPVCRLSYPSGFQHLPRVREALLGDLGR